jgi:hypothetical protein
MLLLWHLPTEAPGSGHTFKYRLALVINGVCVLRYDNKSGKGDHKQIGEIETAYTFESPRQLLMDFWHDVNIWRSQHE